jgi:hypothetical protein
MPLGFGSPQSASLGYLGSVYITDTAAHEGQFGCIIAHEAAVAALVSGKHPTLPGQDASTASNVVEGTLTAVVLPVGVPMLGLFTSITLASGKVTAYKV